MRRIALGTLIVVAAVAALVSSAAGGSQGSRTWQVTITNLTPAGSQPLSPPLLVVHSRQADVWSVGTIATHPVAAIAEDANNAPAESALTGYRGVLSVRTGAGGPIPPGAARTHTVRLEARWWLADQPHAADNLRASQEFDLPRDVSPGEDIAQAIWMATPAQPGPYDVEIRVRQVAGAEFDGPGDMPLRARIVLAARSAGGVTP